MKPTNPFITTGYAGPDYFCDRKEETARLYRELTNGNNIVLLAHRRMGKTGLVEHCVATNNMKKDFNVFVVDIFSAKNQKDFTLMLANAMVDNLKSFDRRSLDLFLSVVTSLQGVLSGETPGGPTLKVQYAGRPKPDCTLEQLFDFVRRAKKPSLLAIDEFQQVAKFPEKNTEALLRTYIQKVPDSRFVFAGSERRVMGRMFTEANSPFYQSATPMHLAPINPAAYADFIEDKFEGAGKAIDREIIQEVYDKFDGITWYVQKLMNAMFSLTRKGERCSNETYSNALDEILRSYDYIYEETLFNMPEKQKELLIALAREGATKELQSDEFCSRYGMSASSVQSARNGLLKKECITEDLGNYHLYDKFLEIWIKTKY